MELRSQHGSVVQRNLGLDVATMSTDGNETIETSLKIVRQNSYAAKSIQKNDSNGYVNHHAMDSNGRYEIRCY